MSKNKDPAVLFYTSDFISGTMGLTMAERGQYITLLCLQHQMGHLSLKEIELAVGKVSADVMAKFKKDSFEKYYNERMDSEIEARRNYCRTKQENGSKGGRPKKPKQNLLVPVRLTETKPKQNLSVPVRLTETKPKQNLTENENINEDISNTVENNNIFSFSSTGGVSGAPAREEPPAPEAVKEYCKVRGYDFAELFYAHFQSKGWAGVADWRARADLWYLEDKVRAERAAVATPRHGDFSPADAMAAAIERSKQFIEEVAHNG